MTIRLSTQSLPGVLLALSLSVFGQSVPTVINYQGRLTDNSPAQTPVNATVQMQFAIYDAPSGGTRLWQEPAADNTGTAVTVATGIFNYVLGSTVAIPASVFTGATSVRYLQITVNPATSPEILSPRRLVTATGYASLAENAGYAAAATTAFSATDSSQLGGVAASGYLLTGGTAFDSARLGGSLASLYQKTLASPGCPAGQFFTTVNADGTSTCDSPSGFSGTLAGDVTGTQAATVVGSVGGQSAANVAAGTLLANGADDANTVSAIVKRDASGNFSAGTIAAALSGNASTATALAANGANCAPGNYPLGVDAGGAVENCTAVPAGGVSAVSASAPLASSGGATPDISLTGVIGVANGGTGNAAGNAATATALAGNGANCAAGNYPLGVDAGGAAEGCTAAPVYTAGPGLVLTGNQFSLSGLTAPSPPHTEGNRDSGSNDIMGGAMTIGADALGLIAFRDLTNQDLKVGHCANTNCTALNPVNAARVDGSANNVGYYASIAIGTDGFGLVAYQDNTFGDLKVAHCGDTNCTAAAATVTRVDGDGLGGAVVFLGFYPSIAIGADGFGVIAQYDSLNQDLRVTHCSNTSCTAATSFSVDTAGDVGIYPSLAIGTDGLPLISYQDVTNNNLKVVHCGNAACTASNTISLVDGAATNVGPNTHITIGSDGFGVISYTDTVPTANVKVAHCQNVLCNGAWNVTVIGAAVSGNTSIAVGDDGMAVFTYLDTFSSIRVGHCGNVLCTSATTSALGAANGNASITIGSDGLPLVARIGTLNVLTVTHCSSPFCVPNTRRR